MGVSIGEAKELATRGQTKDNIKQSNNTDDILHELKVEDLKELNLSSSSKGNQRKWMDTQSGQYVKEQFYYQNKYWDDWKVEILATKISKSMNTTVQVLEQLPVKLDCGTFAVVSKDFCKNDESFVSFNRILKKYGLDFNEKLFTLVKFDFVRDTVQLACSIDITEYLIVMILLDYILLNEDRHLNNFGVIWGNGKYREAPLFDFGLGLFEHDKKYENKTYDSAVARINGKPFCEDMFSIIYALSRSAYKDILKRVVPKVTYEDLEMYAPNELSRVHLKAALMNLKGLNL